MACDLPDTDEATLSIRTDIATTSTSGIGRAIVLIVLFGDHLDECDMHWLRSLCDLKRAACDVLDATPQA